MLSDDGKHLAYAMHKEEDDFGVVLLDLDTMESKSFMLAGQSSFPLMWLDNDRIILYSERNGYSYYSIKSGKSHVFNRKEAWSMSILGARRDQPGLLNVWYTPYDRYTRTGPAIIKPDKPLTSIPGQLNERTNVTDWIDMPPGEQRSVIQDARGRIRAAVTYNKSVNALEYYYRQTEESPWIKLSIDGNYDDFTGYSDDPDIIYIGHRAADEKAASIWRYNVTTQKFTDKLFSDPEFSLLDASLARSYQDGSVQGVYYENDGPATHWIDPAMAKIQQDIDQKLPGRVNLIVDSDIQDTRFIVASHVDRLPKRYYLYFKAKNQLAALPDSYPLLKDVPLQPMQVIHYNTRDGLRLSGYLTLPAKSPSGGKPPLVVLAHGGPWVRDVWGFDSQVQFLASLGYAVFQPNYRGSSGYSYAISKQDEFNFRAMHEDVTDGVLLLKRSNLIDPDRIAIMGGSFGGYLAMAGAAFEPDLYRCAITIAGVFDWAKMIGQRSSSRFDRFNYDILKDRLGDARKEKEAFDQISPLRHTESIHIPVYISAGESDRTVDASQSKKLAHDLKDQGNVVVDFFPDSEGHSYFKTKNRIRLYTEIEAFLKKNL